MLRPAFTKNDVKINENEIAFSLSEMILALADKKQRRAKKGLSFNYFLLNRDGAIDELDDFLAHLQSVKDKLPNGTRFQVVYLMSDPTVKIETDVQHSSVVDIRVNHGKFEFFLLDAANSLAVVLSAAITISNRCPHSVIRYSSGMMQTDGKSCHTFTLDHMYRLAKIPNLHETLATLDDKFSVEKYHEFIKSTLGSNPQLLSALISMPCVLKLCHSKEKTEIIKTVLSGVNGIRYILTKDFPVEFSPLVRNSQNMLLLTNTFQIYPQAMGSDSKHLVTYLQNRVKSRAVFSPETAENTSVTIKRINIKNKAKQMLLSLDEKEFLTVLQDRADYKMKLDALVPQLSVSAVMSDKKLDTSLLPTLRPKVPAKETLLFNVDNAEYTNEELAIAIADKKQRRAKKGMVFNCFVLDRCNTVDELEELLLFLQKEKANFVDGMRFQLLIRSKKSEDASHPHSCVVDILISKGKLKFYLLDAANALPHILNNLMLISKVCPDADIKYSGIELQYDSVNCATFALDHAYLLAKIPNLHNELKVSTIDYVKYLQGIITEGKNTADDLIKCTGDVIPKTVLSDEKLEEGILALVKKSQYVSYHSFPAHFGPLLRNAQNTDDLEEFCEAKYKGNDLQSLADYTNDKIRFIPNPRSTFYPPISTNYNIVLKRKSIKEKAKVFLATLDEKLYLEIIENRKGFQVLESMKAGAKPAALIASLGQFKVLPTEGAAAEPVKYFKPT